MFRQIGTGEIVIILVVLLLMFGARRLPDLARSIGKSTRELRRGLRGAPDEEERSEEDATRHGLAGSVDPLAPTGRGHAIGETR
ncbi:MAG: twin-arginine translocase TatA/TatE family subunit [Actinomycetota bacterium]